MTGFSPIVDQYLRSAYKFGTVPNSVLRALKCVGYSVTSFQQRRNARLSPRRLNFAYSIPAVLIMSKPINIAL